MRACVKPWSHREPAGFYVNCRRHKNTYLLLAISTGRRPVDVPAISVALSTPPPKQPPVFIRRCRNLSNKQPLNNTAGSRLPCLVHTAMADHYHKTPQFLAPPPAFDPFYFPPPPHPAPQPLFPPHPPIPAATLNDAQTTTLADAILRIAQSVAEATVAHKTTG